MDIFCLGIKLQHTFGHRKIDEDRVSGCLAQNRILGFLALWCESLNLETRLNHRNILFVMYPLKQFTQIFVCWYIITKEIVDCCEHGKVKVSGFQSSRIFVPHKFS